MRQLSNILRCQNQIMLNQNLLDEALSAISEKAIERKTGARGLRSIIEEALIDIMYDVPSTENVSKVVITEQTINEEIEPELYDSEGNLVNESKTSA